MEFYNTVIFLYYSFFTASCFCGKIIKHFSLFLFRFVSNIFFLINRPSLMHYGFMFVKLKKSNSERFVFRFIHYSLLSFLKITKFIQVILNSLEGYNVSIYVIRIQILLSIKQLLNLHYKKIHSI